MGSAGINPIITLPEPLKVRTHGLQPTQANVKTWNLREAIDKPHVLGIIRERDRACQLSFQQAGVDGDLVCTEVCLWTVAPFTNSRRFC
jgi:hypothetical protein